MRFTQRLFSPDVAVVLALAATSWGCGGREEAPVPGKALPAVRQFVVGGATGTDGAEIPEAMRSELAGLSTLQSAGLDEATVEVHRAYSSPADAFRLEAPQRKDHKVVVVDVTFKNVAEGFDLDDVDIINTRSGENYGSDPDMYGVLADGQIGDINEREVLKPGAAWHVLLVYAVPDRCDAIRLGYWGKTVTAESIALQPTGPALPGRKAVASCDVWPAGAAPQDFDRYFARVAIRDSYRTDDLDDAWEMVSSDNAVGYVDRVLETDESGRPLADDKGDRPATIPMRWMLMEFWMPHGKTPRILRCVFLNERDFAVSFATPAILEQTVTALAQQDPSFWAKHRTWEERSESHRKKRDLRLKETGGATD
jgi:hypothetical protein